MYHGEFDSTTPTIRLPWLAEDFVPRDGDEFPTIVLPELPPSDEQITEFLGGTANEPQPPEAIGAPPAPTPPKGLERYTAEHERVRQRKFALHLLYGTVGTCILGPLIGTGGYMIAHETVSISNVQVPPVPILAGVAFGVAIHKTQTDYKYWREARAEAQRIRKGQRRRGKSGHGRGED